MSVYGVYRTRAIRGRPQRTSAIFRGGGDTQLQTFADMRGGEGSQECRRLHFLQQRCLSQDKGISGQEFFFVLGQRDNGTSRGNPSMHTLHPVLDHVGSYTLMSSKIVK